MQKCCMDLVRPEHFEFFNAEELHPFCVCSDNYKTQGKRLLGVVERRYLFPSSFYANTQVCDALQLINIT